MSWTDDRVEILKKMWAEGNSASAIAKELGGVTRNAVIGKVHRLGLSNRATTKTASTTSSSSTEKTAPKASSKASAKAKAETPPKAAETKEAPTAAVVQIAPIPPRRPVGIPGQPLPPQPTSNEINPETLANIAEFEKSAKKISLMQLTERTCKWPIGDPATDEFWFCGHPCAAGKPYCEQHVSIAFQPMSSRRDRRASR